MQPVVAFVTPPEGAQFELGEVVHFTIAAVASAGVARVELLDDGNVVAAQPNPNQSPTFSARIAYMPNRTGRVTFQAVAVDANGRSSEPAVLNIVYGASATPTPAPPPPGAHSSVTPGESGCRLAALFLQDVTVPDGTVMRAGTVFTKTWRMRNVSSCDWGEGYTLAHESDTVLGSVRSVAVNPTPSNANVDISVPMVAPRQPGVYTSTWRLKDPSGQWFGNRVFVVIRVP